MMNSNNHILPIFLLLIFTSTYLSKPFVLASDDDEPHHRLTRPDPLHHFKAYNGGYDIRNKHYWASAAFTGIHGYAIAGAWILGGLGFGIFLLMKNLSNSPPVTDHSDSYHLSSFLIVIIFILLAIVLSGIVLGANRSFNWRATKFKRTLLGVAGEARRKIRRVNGAMKEMVKLLSPYNEFECHRLNSTSEKLEKEARIIHRIVHKKRRSIDKALRISYVATVVVVSVNLMLVIAALGFLLLHWRSAFIMIIFVYWILIAACWVFVGFHFFLHTFTVDTCSALEAYQQNPENNTLSSIIPCVNLVSANYALLETGAGIHDFITQLNSNITRIVGMLGVSEQMEGSLARFRQVCNPFSGAPQYDYDPSRCSKDSIQIGDISHVLQRFTCYGNSTRICNVGGKFLSENSFNIAQAYTLSIQSLINVFPDLESLTKCSFLKDTFSTILLYQCRPLKFSSRLLWASMLSLSAIMVLLEVAWIVKSYQSRRFYSHEDSIIHRSETAL